MEITADHVATAIAVRRGQHRLRDLPAADRAAVNYVLQTTSDARLAQAVLSTQRPRERAFVVRRPRQSSFR
jgi:hypothetical protein